MDAAQELTGATAVGFCSMLSPVVSAEVHARGMAESFLDNYEREGRALDLQWSSAGLAFAHVARVRRDDQAARAYEDLLMDS